MTGRPSADICYQARAFQSGVNLRSGLMSRYYKLACCSVVAISVAFSLALTAQAQGRPGGGGQGGRGGIGGGGAGGAGGFGGFGGFGGGGELMLLQNEQLRDELGIVDEQVEKLQALGTKSREQMRELFQGMQNLSQEERQAKMEEIREKMQTSTEQLRKDMEGILLPNQVKRLEQIQRQQRMRFGGGGQGGMNSDFIATELKLTDEQKEKLRQKAQEVEKKLREKTAKLRKEAEDELMSVLTVEQRSQWKEMIGEQF